MTSVHSQGTQGGVSVVEPLLFSVSPERWTHYEPPASVGQGQD